MHRLLHTGRSLIAIPLALVLMAALGAGFALRTVDAQNDPAAAHPASIIAGDCGTLGEVVAPLSNVSGEFLVDGASTAAAEPAGAATAIPVKASVTTVQLGLDAMLDSAHALTVRASDEGIENYIACGDIGGTTFGDGSLAFGLAELNDSDYFGNALLQDNGDGTTTVTVFIMHSDQVDDVPDDDADDAADDDGADDSDDADDADDSDDSDAAAAAPAAAANVTIEGFAFNPQTIEIAVGDTVTWTNNDSSLHTATQDPPGSEFQSGSLEQGDTFSFTFDYFCEFHGIMSGAIIVS